MSDCQFPQSRVFVFEAMMSSRIWSSHDGFAANGVLQQIDTGDSPLHIFKIFAVGLVVGQESDFGGGVGFLQYFASEVNDGDRLVTANIKDASGGGGVECQVEYAADDFTDVSKAADLGAIVVDGER